MSKKILIATAVGSAFVASLAAAPVASAATIPLPCPACLPVTKSPTVTGPSPLKESAAA